MKHRLICLALLGALMPVPAAELPDLGDSALADLPAHEERRIGDMVARELRRSGEVLDDAEVYDYLNDIGYRLVSSSNNARIDFRFFPVESPQINAWAVPGGVIAINTGLMALSQHESELAAVMAHEIAHVTQHHYARLMESQKSVGIASLAGLAVAILAARSNPEAAQATIAATQGYQAQHFLSFSRDFEREADRVGMDTLQKAGFDVRAMPTFFDRMQRFYRNVDNGALAFLRTHPVTLERIADSQSRAEQQPFRQLPDSLDYLLVREKMRAIQFGVIDAPAQYARLAEQGRYGDPASFRYGYANALHRAGRFDAAWAQIEQARRLTRQPHPMIEALAGRILIDQGKFDEAAQVFAEARQRFSASRSLMHGEIDVALRRGEPRQAILLAENAIALRPSDAELQKRLAEAYTQINDPVRAHRAQAEFYALRGEDEAAVEQLRIALRTGRADFYESSAMEARLKTLRARIDEARKQTR
jgi:predicted Zn-dependent protease